METKNTVLFLTLFTYLMSTLLLVSGELPRSTSFEHTTLPEGGSSDIATREHSQAEFNERIREQNNRLKFSTHPTETTTGSFTTETTHHSTTPLMQDGNLTAPPLITVVDGNTSSLPEINAKEVALLLAGEEKTNFSTVHKHIETPQELSKEEKREKSTKLIMNFRTQLREFNEKLHKNEELSTKQIDELQDAFMNAALEDPQDSFIPLFLEEAKTLSAENKRAHENLRAQEEPSAQEIVTAGIARGQERPEYKAFIEFRAKLMTEKHLELTKAIELAIELKNLVEQDPHNSAAIEQKKIELLKEADALNTEKDQKNKTAQDKAAQEEEKAQKEQAVQEAEVQRVGDLKKDLIKNFEDQLLTRRNLTKDDILNSYRAFEQLVNRDPDNTEIINAKSAELLEQADGFNELGSLEKAKEIDEQVRQMQEKAEQKRITTLTEIFTSQLEKEILSQNLNLATDDPAFIKLKKDLEETIRQRPIDLKVIKDKITEILETLKNPVKNEEIDNDHKISSSSMKARFIAFLERLLAEIEIFLKNSKSGSDA